MIFAKFDKKYPSSYLANQDQLRTFMRTLRRAGIDVNMSQGYHKHMRVFFTPPLPIGVESTAEYVVIDTDTPVEEFVERYNTNCLSTMRISFAKYVEVNPNPSAKVYSSEYLVKGLNNPNKVATHLTESNEVWITYDKDGEITNKQVKEMILSAQASEEGLILVLRSGNTNLRVDRLMCFVEKEFGEESYSILRKEQYTIDGASLMNIG